MTCRASERQQKNAPACDGTGAKYSLGGARFVRPSCSQPTHAGLQGPYTEARLCPEVEPRELSADHLQLVLRASFVEPVDQRINGRICSWVSSRRRSGVSAGTERVVAERRRLVMDQPSL